MSPMRVEEHTVEPVKKEGKPIKKEDEPITFKKEDERITVKKEDEPITVKKEDEPVFIKKEDEPTMPMVKKGRGKQSGLKNAPMGKPPPLEFENLDDSGDIQVVVPPVVIVQGSDSEAEPEYEDGELIPGLQSHFVAPQPKVLPQPKKSPKARGALVKVYSGGWNSFECQWNKKFQELANEMMERICARFRGMDPVGVFIDTRMFYQRPFSGHCGTYDLDIRQFVKNSHFRGWLQNAKSLLLELMLEGSYEGICSVCKAGHNRSVTGAVILESCLRKSGRETMLVHLNKASWASRKKMCSTCHRCTKMTAMKQEALDDAYYMWRRM